MQLNQHLSETELNVITLMWLGVIVGLLFNSLLLKSIIIVEIAVSPHDNNCNGQK